MRLSRSLTLTLQSDHGFTVGECLSADGLVLSGRTPLRLVSGERWTFRLELPRDLGAVVGRLRVLSHAGEEWRARVLSIQGSDRVAWERWQARHRGGASARPSSAVAGRGTPASAITPEALRRARAERPRRPRTLRGLLGGSTE